jgi:hypothetical protein
VALAMVVQELGKVPAQAKLEWGTLEMKWTDSRATGQNQEMSQERLELLNHGIHNCNNIMEKWDQRLALQSLGLRG